MSYIRKERVVYTSGEAPLSNSTITYQDTGDKDGVSNIIKKDIEKVDIGAAGIVGGLNSGFLVEDVKNIEKFSIQAGMFQAVKRGVSSSYDSLAVRDIIPSIDFRDGSNLAVDRKEWRQPWSGNYTTVSGSTLIYQTNTQVNYDKKVYLFWGVKLCNTGPGRTSGSLDSSVIEFADSAGNRFDMWQIENLNTSTALYTYTPIIYDNNRAMKLSLYPKAGSSGNWDNLILLGKVVEPLGDQITGTKKIMFG